ncbi:RNA methyltransferase, TrmH family [Saccharicrinis carchari]|uniref:RNA methyltransferase, TrmH family n=1 Tax=Saccharicrinis carchari TaxID=1168039 RepID=A0A521E4T3_SACCC|nr:RNA methyltransferase [Saccharicrinis carchari]SMO78371.1 RNA methyltransferase, TrmH family [Saccharicrinis carchari]
MISQSKIKLINSLTKKKYREQNQLFIAEGEKLVLDLIRSNIKVIELFVSESFTSISQLPPGLPCIKITEQQLKKITQLKSPSTIIALCQIPQNTLDPHTVHKGLTLALDDIQDPGNLGTIIRLADWFGVKHIICSKNTADAYNPKVVQATMGAIARVAIYYTDLTTFLAEQKENQIPIYGTSLDGENIYGEKLTNKGIIVMGNEGKGISPTIAQQIDKKLLIPSFSEYPDHSESLNVSMATGIVLSEFRRKASGDN